jgi:hypothetical protein
MELDIRAFAFIISLAAVINAATSVDICKIDVRNCDTPVSKDEIALPWEPELARESRACQSVANNIRLACRDFL